MTFSQTTNSKRYFNPVSPYNSNFFKVNWWVVDGEYPNASNQCGNGACVTVSNGCLCDVEVENTMVFSSIPNVTEANTLTIGSSHPDCDYTLETELSADVLLYKKQGTPIFSKYTVFGVMRNGKMTYITNVV